ncbi:MAG TPA: dephospho-CoA kinase [Candidatus Gastranaerophilales bacterium]|nr:dephospho-CoA kinase [Candidatus Gastranaerophilales bacterium]
MIKIAITGNIASGKSLVEEFFRQEGAATLDADKIVHDLLKNNQNIIKSVYELFNSYGFEVKNKKGSIDRQKVGQIAFSDTKKLKALEKIIHPEVKKVIEEFFQLNKEKKLVVISVPLLFESDMENMFDYVIAVVADEKIRLERLINTRNLTQEQALKRIRAQNFGEEQLKKADFIIENNISTHELKLEVKKIIKAL